MSRILLPFLLVPLLLGGCGQVITRVEPSPTPTPTLEVVILATTKPTATPAPYTPAPTSTPTITPTPIIYQIQRGDSLLQIASQFGVSVQGLQDANGITDPRTLQIGQELVIPREVEVGSGTPTATATPLPFTVHNVSFSHTPLGGLWCFGEILNETGLDLEQAGVWIDLLDEKGEVLASAQEYVQIDLIASGARAPFALRFTNPPRSFASYSARPWVGVRGYVGNYYRDLAVGELVGVGERYAAYRVSGVIANFGPEDTIGVTLTVTLYDALGRVIGTRRGVPEHNVIPRGGQTSFSLELTPSGGPVDTFRVEVLGRRLLPSTAPDSVATPAS